MGRGQLSNPFFLGDGGDGPIFFVKTLVEKIGHDGAAGAGAENHDFPHFSLPLQHDFSVDLIAQDIFSRGRMSTRFILFPSQLIKFIRYEIYWQDKIEIRPSHRTAQRSPLNLSQIGS
jgi:hypothetical protein